MRPFSRNAIPLLLPLLASLTLAACESSTEPALSDDPGDPADAVDPVPSGYPAVPRPAHANDFDVPDESERLAVVAPIEGKDVDFAPTWTEGTFTWDIDVQTQYEVWTLANGWIWTGDAPGDYVDGTAHSSTLLFENGQVDLRSPAPKASNLDTEVPTFAPMPRQLAFVQDGVALAEPYNPGVRPHDPAVPSSSECHFLFVNGYPTTYFTPCVFVGHGTLAVAPGFAERNRMRVYSVAATQAALLTTPVFLKRERYWERVLVDGTKSVRVDPGFSKSVSYTRTRGTSIEATTSFAETLDAELKGGAPKEVIGGSLGYSVTETFSTSRQVFEQESETVTHQVTGISDKTVIFSVWQSVERYTFVDAEGHPYTDPGYTFADLGMMEIRGDHEILQSAIFDGS